MVPGRPRGGNTNETNAFPMHFRGPGHRKVRFGVDFHQKRSFGCFFGENHQNGWNSAEFHHFHQNSNFGAFPAARGSKRAWNLHVLSRVWQGPPETGEDADFTYFTMKSHNFTINHDFTWISRFFMNFHEMSWKSWNWVYSRARAPKQYVLLHYLHDLGSSFRWIPIIFMDFHEIQWFPWIHHKIIKSWDFAVLERNSMINPKGACGYLWIRLYIVSPTAPAAKGTTFGNETHGFHHFLEFHEMLWNSWIPAVFHDFSNCSAKWCLARPSRLDKLLLLQISSNSTTYLPEWASSSPTP